MPVKKAKKAKPSKPFSDPKKMVWPTRYRITLTGNKDLEGLFLGFFRGNPQMSVRPEGGTIDLDVKTIVSILPIQKADYKPHKIRKVKK